MKNFRYQKASTVKEALAQLKAAGGTAKLMAGGTDLLGEMKEGVAHPERVVHLRIPQLSSIQTDSKGKRIDEALAAQAGRLAVFGARPLSQNSYKVELTQTLVRRAVLATV